MKKIINGKMYNTETAELLASKSSAGLASNDFRYWSEDLYRKKTGEFFLFGRGGAMSEYRESVGNGYGWGNKIEPLTIEMARKWAEGLDGDEYIEIFGDVEE